MHARQHAVLTTRNTQTTQHATQTTQHATHEQHTKHTTDASRTATDTIDGAVKKKKEKNHRMRHPLQAVRETARGKNFWTSP